MEAEGVSARRRAVAYTVVRVFGRAAGAAETPSDAFACHSGPKLPGPSSRHVSASRNALLASKVVDDDAAACVLAFVSTLSDVRETEVWRRRAGLLNDAAGCAADASTLC
jgi:hypothetical protein